MPGSEIFQVFGELLHILHGHGIIITGSNTTHAAMALQPLEQLFLSTGQEFLLRTSVTTADTETDVHAAAHALVGDYGVDVRILIQDLVDEGGLFVGNLCLTADLFGTICVQQASDHRASNPQVEDGKRVVQRVVFCSRRIVKHHRPRNTAKIQSAKERRRGCGGLWRQKGFS